MDHGTSSAGERPGEQRGGQRDEQPREQRGEQRVISPGVVVAVDVGSVRVGVAASDPHRILASPVETVPAPGLQRVAEIVAEREAVLVVVGLPTSLSGQSWSASAQMARDWAAQLARLVVVPLELVDERLTTVTATQALRASGKKGKQARAVVDQAAAVALLQGVLDRRP